LVAAYLRFVTPRCIARLRYVVTRRFAFRSHARSDVVADARSLHSPFYHTHILRTLRIYLRLPDWFPHVTHVLRYCILRSCPRLRLVTVTRYTLRLRCRFVTGLIHVRLLGYTFYVAFGHAFYAFFGLHFAVSVPTFVLAVRCCHCPRVHTYTRVLPFGSHHINAFGLFADTFALLKFTHTHLPVYFHRAFLTIPFHVLLPYRFPWFTFTTYTSHSFLSFLFLFWFSFCRLVYVLVRSVSGLHFGSYRLLRLRITHIQFRITVTPRLFSLRLRYHSRHHCTYLRLLPFCHVPLHAFAFHVVAPHVLLLRGLIRFSLPPDSRCLRSRYITCSRTLFTFARWLRSHVPWFGYGLRLNVCVALSCAAFTFVYYFVPVPFVFVHLVPRHRSVSRSRLRSLVCVWLLVSFAVCTFVRLLHVCCYVHV